ncbi:ferritin-like protein [Streptomyces sp. NPDC050263]|uniref:ferritin-like domain-containing protein n=1 Tax=Streptomyces sp. NPDC050263 TaxID=3155037 RepID=UPI00342B7B92
MSEPKAIDNLKDLKAALQLAIGLELSTIPVYLTALYSIKEGTNTDAAQTIRSVVMEEMLHMTLAANVLNAIGETPSIAPVEFQKRENLSPVPSYPLMSPLISEIGTLDLLPLTPEAVASFVKIEHPLHGAASLRGIDVGECSYRTIGEFYEAIKKALKDRKICKDDKAFQHGHQVPADQYYGGAGSVVEVTDRASALAAIQKIVDEGEGLPEERLGQKAKTVTDKDALINGWEMYSHYARFRELQTGRRFRSTQKAAAEPEGALLLVDYGAVHPALHVPRNGDSAGDAEDTALIEFDLLYSALVDDLYLAFSGEPKQVRSGLGDGGEVSEPALPVAVHTMFGLKRSAIALMRTPNPAKRGYTLCPRFSYVPIDERRKLSEYAQELKERSR